MTTRGTPTPGPWKVVEPFDVYDEWRVAIDDNDPGVAVVAVMDSQPENEANAHLIAAAYDYHEAMTECLKPDHGYNIEYVSIPLKVWQRFLAAHAKAEGSTPTPGEQG